MYGDDFWRMVGRLFALLLFFSVVGLCFSAWFVLNLFL